MRTAVSTPITSNKRGRRSASEWRALMRAFSQSGETRAQFCDRHGLSLSTFAWWRSHLRHELTAASDATPSTVSALFVELAQEDKPVTQTFWRWCDEQCHRPDLVPSNPLSKALKYARARRVSPQVFLSDPEVPVDTNHLERALRPMPMGRRNWLFCWTELGAKQVGIIQSLIATCKLHGVDVYMYLVDVLQRVSQHPAKDVIDLTPRVWKTKFAHDPMRSDIALADQ